MRTFGEEIENGCECVRGERRGQLQCRADIPAMHGEFKDAGVDACVHRDNSERMMAGFVPIFRAQGGDKMREGVPALAEHRHEVVAKTLSVRDGSLASLLLYCCRSSCECVWKTLD